MPIPAMFTMLEGVKMSNYQNIAKQAYNNRPPLYVVVLAQALDKPNMPQWKVAQQIGYSRTAVSMVVHNKYDRPHDGIKEAILEHLMHVECPLFACAINIEVCAKQQKKPFWASNPKLKEQWYQCNACPHNKQGRQ